MFPELHRSRRGWRASGHLPGAIWTTPSPPSCPSGRTVQHSTALKLPNPIFRWLPKAGWSRKPSSWHGPLRLPFSSPSPDSCLGCAFCTCASCPSVPPLPPPPAHHLPWAASPSTIRCGPVLPASGLQASPDGEQRPSHRATQGEGSKSGSEKQRARGSLGGLVWDWEHS